jgi:nitrite reductase (NO-forming)
MHYGLVVLASLFVAFILISINSTPTPRPVAPSSPPSAAAPVSPVTSPQTARTEPAVAQPAAPAPARTAQPAPSRPASAPPSAAPAAPPAATTAHLAGAHTAPGDGDVAEGRKVYRKCQSCHSPEPGRNLVGPSLAGIVGKPAASVAGFNYSDALKKSNIVWTRDKLEAYLKAPQAMVPGNRMPFPGLKSQHELDDVVAYLQSISGGTQTAQAQPGAPAAQAPRQPRVTLVPRAVAQPTAITDMSDVSYTLRTGIAEGRLVFLGVGGVIDGKVNPVLTAAEGQVVQVTLINGEGADHDIVFPDQATHSPRVIGKGASTTVAFRADKLGDFIYFCSIPGHREAGMEGKFLVTPHSQPGAIAYADLSREATDLPPPLAKRPPQTIRVDLVSEEVEGRLAEGTTFAFWTFNGRVPGPFVRARVGDTIDIHVKNAPSSSMIHSVDFHAATGPGGGAAALQVEPGGEKSMKFKLLTPGLYVYHCATPMVAEHIANGMYGLILVEPEEGLPKVDHEFYVMQGEIYTDEPYGQHGSMGFSVEKLLAERPEYFIFNGSVGALTTLHPLRAKVGETVRIFFGVGGPNFTSSFHVIGEIFDRVYNQGSVITPPLEGVQTTTVPAGGAVIVEFKLDVPGKYTLVDHALSRAERGLVGMLIVDGPPNPEIFDGVVPAGPGAH